MKSKLSYIFSYSTSFDHSFDTEQHRTIRASYCWNNPLIRNMEDFYSTAKMALLLLNRHQYEN